MSSTRLLLRQPQDEIYQVLDLRALQALAETRHRAPAVADAQVDLAAAAGAGADHPRRGEVQARIEATPRPPASLRRGPGVLQHPEVSHQRLDLLVVERLLETGHQPERPLADGIADRGVVAAVLPGVVGQVGVRLPHGTYRVAAAVQAVALGAMLAVQLLALAAVGKQLLTAGEQPGSDDQGTDQGSGTDRGGRAAG